MKTSIISLMLLISTFTSTYKQVKKKDILVQLSLPTSVASSAKDLIISLKIQNNTIKPLVIPRSAFWGFNIESKGFYFIWVEKKKNGLFKDVPDNSRRDTPPISDYDTLRKGDSRVIKSPIATPYDFSEGDYRVQVSCQFPSIDDKKEFRSNWVYFHCTRKIDP